MVAKVGGVSGFVTFLVVFDGADLVTKALDLPAFESNITNASVVSKH